MSKKPFEVPLKSESAAKRPFWSSIKYFAKSGIDVALQNIWTVIGSGIVTVIIAIVVYLWSGQAQWLYLYLKFGVAFLAGMLWLIVIILFLTVVKLRKEKALGKIISNKFLSTQKGLLDHRVDFQKAQKEFPIALSKLANDMRRIGNTALNSRIEFWEGIGVSWSRRSASITAAKLIKHTKRMELHSKELGEVITILDVSITYLLRSNSIERERFPAVRLALEELLSSTQGSINSTTVFRDTQSNAIGVSQDLNTALNQMIHITNGTIRVLKQAETIWIRLIALIEEISNQAE